MFTQYHPNTFKMFQVMDDNGTIIEQQWMPELKPADIVNGYKKMLFARIVDIQIVSYQRQGRIYTYPPNYGQEAIAVVAGLCLGKNDWLVPAYRELGTWLEKGMSLEEIFLFWGGYEEGLSLKQCENMLPINLSIASQLPHAVGVAFALKYQKKEGAVLTFIGDGGTSEGDFHEALNFASVWKVPLLILVQNNGYAISQPFEQQTGSKSIAIKAGAYGIDGIQIDGNDFFACYAAIRAALSRIRKKSEPILVEAVTYRLGAHTTADDPTRYRSKEEEEVWRNKDPIKRLRQYCLKQALINDADEENLVSQFKKQIEIEFEKYERHPRPPLHDCFAYMYDEIPDNLRGQEVQLEKFLRWKEQGK